MRPRRALAVVVAACVLVAGLATSAAADDSSEGFVDAETDCWDATDPFDDMNGEHFAAHAVSCLFVLDIVQGKTPSRFDPSSVLRRNQLAAMLARAWRGVDLECPSDVSAPYIDIAEDWAKEDIDCLWSLGATAPTTVTAGFYDDPPAGTPDRTVAAAAASDTPYPATPSHAAANEPLSYHPGAGVTKAQFALMVANTWQAAGFSCERWDGFNFTDVDYASRAGAAIDCLQQLGAIVFDPNTAEFEPDTPITRDEAAVMLARLWREDPFAPPTTTTTIPQAPSTQDPPTQDPAPTAPATPAAPTLTAGDAKIDASWTAPSDGGSAITGYSVRHRATGNADWTTSTVGSATTSHEITTLTNDTEYEVQVQATNTVGSSDWSDSAKATPAAPSLPLQDPPQDPAPTVPAKPAAPTLTAGNATLSASWSAPDDGGADITGYKVRHRFVGASNDESVLSWATSSALGADTRSYEIGSLTNGHEYEVQVQATNSVGDSAWSPSTNAMPRTVPAKPAAPALTSGDAKIDASWTSPINRGSAITGYSVRHRATGTSTWTTSTLGASTTSHEITTLTNDTEYEVQVQATNSVGSSDWSDSAKATPRAVPTKPATPAAPSLTAGDTKIDASWTAPSNGGSAITGYSVRHRATGTSTWTTSSSMTTTSYAIGSLDNGTEYEVQVQASNSVGDSGWSGSAKATPAAVPSKPAAPSLTAGNAKLTASWTAPSNGGSAITGYTVRHRATGTSTWTTSSSMTATSYEIGTLTNGTEYEVQVQATNTAGDSGYSDSTKATPRTVPTKPSPTLSAADKKLTASWTAPSNGGSAITGYEVRHRATGTSTWTTSSSMTTTSYEIGTLTNGTEYEVQAQATNSVGDSGWSDSVKATPAAVPSKPAAPTLTAGNAKLTASWTAPNNGGSAITGYEVRHRATGTSTWTTSSSMTATSYEIGTLTNGTEYEVQVQATNTAGDSGYSDSTKATPRTVPTKPSPTLTVGDSKLTASWTAPTDGGSSITGYTVRHRATGATDWTTSSSTTATSYEIGSLTNATEYEVQVQATNAAGDSGYSDSVKAKPCTVPAKPAKPTLTPADEKITASWTAPNNGGCAIKRYRVTHREKGTTEWTSATVTTTSLEISSLTNGTEYEVTVAAANAHAGLSEWSDSAFATPRTVPSKPSPTLTSSDKKLTASWSAPSNGGSAITGYEVRHRATGTSTWTTSDSTTTTSYEIGSLTNGTEYEVQAQATNAAGDSGWSDSVKATPRTVPSKPAAPSLTVGNAKLTASWTAPSNGGSAITGYTVRHRATGTSTWTTSNSTTATSYEIGTLTNGTEYEVQVQATNAAGDSGYSDSTKATPRTVPTKPSPTLSPADKKLTASWTAPNNGGSAITGYKVRHRATGTSTWTTSDSMTTTSYEIGTLTNGTEYEVQAQATNSVGDSGWSDSVKATPRTVPSKPAAPSLTVGNAKLTASWTAPSNGGSAITGYTVRHRATGTSTWTTSNSTTATSYEIGTLTNGTEYEVQVQATNAAGDSGYSDSTKATPRTVPTKPSPTLSPADKKLTASWTAPNNGGSAITGYKVRHRATGTSTWTTSNSMTTTSYEIGTLTNGTEYEVQVQAANTAGDSGYSDSTKATPRTVPSKPSPTLSAADQKITASWSAPTNGGSAITGYKVRHRATGTSTWTTSSSMTTTSYEISSLTNGTEYEVQVQATNAAGDSGYSDSAKATPRTVPSKPATPTLTAANKKLTVTWTAPANGGSAITGYKVRHRVSDVSSSPWTTSSALGTSSLSYDITELTNSVEYDVQVQAINAAGDSGWSDSSEATPYTVPSKPSPTLTPAHQKITATWTAPSNNGRAITGYKVRHRETSDTDPNPNSWTTSDSQTTRTYEMSSLTNGTEYEVQVQATNTAGDSGWSDSVNATPRTLPSKPSPTLASGDSKLTVTWTAPSNGGSAITGYKVRHRDKSDTDWTTSSTLGTSPLSYEIGSLSNGGTYEVQMQATNAAGDSGWSDSVEGKPGKPPGAPSWSGASSVSDQSATPNWHAPTALGGGTLSGYTVQWKSGTQSYSTSERTQTVDASNGSITVSNLTNLTKYYFRVRATNEFGDGAWSSEKMLIPHAAVSQPAAPSVSCRQEKYTSFKSKAVFEWTDDYQGTSPITGYTLEWQFQGQGLNTWVTTTQTVAATVKTADQYTYGKYRLKVTATNSVGNSAWSASVQCIAGESGGT